MGKETLRFQAFDAVRLQQSPVLQQDEKRLGALAALELLRYRSRKP
jgi:hypothetical protein